MAEPADPDVLQMCLDLQAAALALFDQVEAGGTAAPFHDPAALFAVTGAFDRIRGYYERRAIRRLNALDPGFAKRVIEGGL